MLALYVTLTTLLHDTATKTQKIREDRGSVTLEQVIITAGIVVLAIAAIAAITTAVQTRIGQIR